MKKYSSLEQKIIKVFEESESIKLEDINYKVEVVGKPRPHKAKGECKTDVYVGLVSEKGCRKELKISVKMKNKAEFQESKLTKERAIEIFGNNWSSIIENATTSIKNDFEDTFLVYADKKGNTQKGSVTMGWRLEVMNKPRKLSVPLKLDTRTILNSFYKGVNLPERKKNAVVEGTIFENSGVAEYLLICSEAEINSTTDVLNKIQFIDDLCPPPLYLSFIANNYRTFKRKIDGARPLAVSVDWTYEDGVVKHKLNFANPLEIKGKELSKKFNSIIDKLDFNQIQNSIDNSAIIYKK